jgi:mannose-1-phosphate guanylyltransferase
VILSGGAGTRLWPLSRAEKPKQFHALVGPLTMLQQAIMEASDEAVFLPPIIVASASHADEVEGQIASMGGARATLVLEPCGRNTGPAIALAALEAGPDQLLLIMPSDQVIGNVSAFLEAVRAGTEAAADGWLVTFGIHPERAETGYGYIRRGGLICKGVYKVDHFVEKPDLGTVRSLLLAGGYDWNGGIFLFRADAYLKALAEHAPDIFNSARRSMAGARRSGNRVEPEPKSFAAARAQSIDRAVMEHASRIAVVPVAMGWSDIGNWQSLWEISGKNEFGNAIAGPVTAVDSRGCLLRSDGPRLMTVGIEDLVVIAAGNSVLVMRREDSQRLGDALKKLAADGDDDQL